MRPFPTSKEKAFIFKREVYGGVSTEEQRAKRRAYYQKNRKKILMYQKRWKSENPEKVAKHQLKTWMKKAGDQQKDINDKPSSL